MSISFDYFKVFCTIAECGSVSSAAKQLFLSQPTVSNELKHLEKTLGYSLFYRLPRKMELTPEGKFLFDLVSDPVKQLSNYKKPSRQAMRFIRFLLEECQFSAREISVAI